jgi:diguanylate cyclase (GGDEF)-like protein
VAERIRADVEDSTVRHGKEEMRVTVSIGVATVSSVDRDVQDVIERADLALYAAKSGGRNRVSLSATPQPAESEAA